MSTITTDRPALWRDAVNVTLMSLGVGVASSVILAAIVLLVTSVAN